jgi:hypothetical protein
VFLQKGHLRQVRNAEFGVNGKNNGNGSSKFKVTAKRQGQRQFKVQSSK